MKSSSYDGKPDQGAPVGATLSQAAQEAREIVDKVAGRADEAARKAIPAAKEFAHKAVDNVASGAASASEWLDKNAGDLDAAQEKLVDDAREYIRANPLKSVGIALVAGFLISRMLR
jgi:ElaB/YqjD/DUF883 family membrane-anchored ribosome-binding protein